MKYLPAFTIALIIFWLVIVMYFNEVYKIGIRVGKAQLIEEVNNDKINSR